MRRIVRSLDFGNERLVVPLLLLITAALYARSLFADFAFDDFAFLLQNERVTSPWSMVSLFFGAESAMYFRPIPELLHAAIYAVFGAIPWPYHLLQILLHGAVGASFYLLLRRFVAPWLAFAAAFLFLVHPINVDAVANAMETRQTLSALFGLLSLLVLLSHWRWRVPVALLCLFLAIFSRESALTFFVAGPLALFLLRRPVPRSLLWGIAFLTGLLIASRMFLTFPNHHDAGNLMAMFDTPLYERLQSIPKMIEHYFRILIYPFPMSVWQNWVVREFTWSDFFRPLLVSSVAGALIVWAHTYLQRIKSPHFLPFTLFLVMFVLSLGGHLQLIPLDMTVWNGWFYVPLVSLLGMLACLIETHLQGGVYSLRFIQLMVIVLTAWIAGLIFLTVLRIEDWQNNLSLYVHDVEYNSSNPVVYNNFGIMMLRLRDYDRALLYINKAIELEPKWGKPYFNAGLAYLDIGKVEHAADAFEKALALQEDEGARVKLARAYLTLPDTAQTIAFIEESLRCYSQNRTFHDYLVVAYYAADDPTQSRVWHAAASRLPPILMPSQKIGRLQLLDTLSTRP